MPRARLDNLEAEVGEGIQDDDLPVLLDIKNRLLALAVESVSNLEVIKRKKTMTLDEQRAAVVHYNSARVIFQTLGFRWILPKIQKKVSDEEKDEKKIAAVLAGQFPREVLVRAAKEAAKRELMPEASSEVAAARAVPLFEGEDEGEDVPVEGIAVE